MKSFLLKLGAFVLIVVAILATMGWAMFGIEKRAYYDTLRLAPEDKYIAIGDSRFEQSLDPAVVKGLRNMSLAGSQIAVWEAQLTDILALNNDSMKRTIIIEASPLQFEASREHRAREYEYDRAILWMLHPELRRSAHFENLYLRHVKNEFPIRLLQLAMSRTGRTAFCSTLKGGFSMPAAQSGYADNEIARMAANRWQELADFRFSVGDEAFLDPIVKLCESRDWDLIVLTLPICGFDPNTTMMRQFRADIAEFCAQHHARYVDLTELCRERKYWIDVVHVNCYGTQIISERLNELLGSAK